MKKVLLIIYLLAITAMSSYAQQVAIRSKGAVLWDLVMYQYEPTYSTQSHYWYEGGDVVCEEFEESNGRYFMDCSGYYNQGVYYMNFFNGELHNVYLVNLFGGTGNFYIGEMTVHDYRKAVTYWNHGVRMTNEEVESRSSNRWGLMEIRKGDDFCIVIE